MPVVGHSLIILKPPAPALAAVSNRVRGDSESVESLSHDVLPLWGPATTRAVFRTQEPIVAQGTKCRLDGGVDILEAELTTANEPERSSTEFLVQLLEIMSRHATPYTNGQEATGLKIADCA